MSSNEIIIFMGNGNYKQSLMDIDEDQINMKRANKKFYV